MTDSTSFFIINTLRLPELIQEDIDSLYDRYEELMTQATHITQEIKPVVGGGGGPAGKIEPLVLQMVKVAEEIESKLRQLYNAREERTKLLNMIPDLNSRALVAARFIDRKSYLQIARENNVSKTTVINAVKRSISVIASEAQGAVQNVSNDKIPTEG